MRIHIKHFAIKLYATAFIVLSPIAIALALQPGYAFASWLDDNSVALPTAENPGILLRCVWHVQYQNAEEGYVSRTLNDPVEAKSILEQHGRNSIWLVIGGYEIYGDFSGALKLPSSLTVGETEYDVKGVWSGAFENFQELTSVIVPGNFDDLSWAFQNCTHLENVTLEEGISILGDDGCGDGAFSGCISLTIVNLPDSIKYMEGAFYGCTSLASVRIPQNATDISYAFQGCTNLENVAFEGGIPSIGQEAFSGCTSLKSITIPASVEEIGVLAFQGCISLEEVNLGLSLKVIDAQAFTDCPKLASIYVPASVRAISASAFDGSIKLRCPKDSYACSWAKAYSVAYEFNPKIALEGAAVVLDHDSFAYDGSPHKPSVQLVAVSGTILAEGTDYMVALPSDCTSTGVKAITVIGQGSYTGTATGSFEIINYTKGEKGDTGTPGAPGPAGAPGAPGAAGNGITKIEKTASKGLVDTYTITFTDGTTTNFNVTNGKNGIDGKDGVDGKNAESTLGSADGQAPSNLSQSQGQGQNGGEAVDVQTRVSGQWIQYRVGSSGKWTNLAAVPDSYGTTFKSASGKLAYKVTGNATAILTSSLAKSFSAPTVKHGYSTYKVTEIADKAFAGSDVRSVALGKHVERIGKAAFAGCTALKVLKVRSAKLTKAAIKGCLKGSSVSIVKVPRAQLKAYRKLFAQRVCGKKVRVAVLL